MEQQLIKLLDKDLKCIEFKIKDKQMILEVLSEKKESICPYCGSPSTRIHSRYEREIQDIPFQDKQTILLLTVRKFFCDNPECTYKTFSERFDFVKPKGKKTTRLIEKIVVTSTKLSSVSAACLLKEDSVKVSKSTINNLLKKNTCDCG